MSKSSSSRLVTGPGAEAMRFPAISPTPMMLRFLDEMTLRPEDLYSADVVFISFTNRNIIGVGEIAGNRIASAPGLVTKRLDELFDIYVTEYVSRRLSLSGAPASKE